MSDIANVWKKRYEDLIIVHKELLKKLPQNQKDIISKDNITLDMNSYTIKLHGEIIPLTGNQYNIFCILFSHPETTFSRERLLTLTGNKTTPFTRTIDVQVNKINKHFGKKIIHCFTGKGYYYGKD